MTKYEGQIFQASLLRAQQEASIEGILVVSLTGRILSHNRRFVELWGISSESLLSGSDDAVLKSVISKLADPASFLARIEYLYAHPLEKSFEEIALTSEQIFERYSAPVVDDAGQVLGRIWFFRDVTQKKISEKKFIDQQNAVNNAARLAALGQMSAEIAHEIVNPLAAITLANNLLRDSAQQLKSDSEPLINHSISIEQSIVRIMKIIKSLRVLAHDSSSVGFERSTIKSIINSTLDFCEPKIKLTGTQIQIFDIPEGLELFCNPVQISQVLLNLINNSLHAIENLPEKWIKIIVTNDNANVKIEIVDSGRGISATVQENMFRSFFTTKAVGVGTGLGLNISKSIIEAHSGNLRINKNSSNTSFIISLPRKAS